MALTPSANLDRAPQDRLGHSSDECHATTGKVRKLPYRVLLLSWFLPFTHYCHRNLFSYNEESRSASACLHRMRPASQTLRQAASCSLRRRGDTPPYQTSGKRREQYDTSSDASREVLRITLRDTTKEANCTDGSVLLLRLL
jgi:hypothetical protein